MTETISLIAVGVMAWLLWREHRNTAAMKEERDKVLSQNMRVVASLNEISAKYARLTDRDEKGRFVKRERGEAL